MAVAGALLMIAGFMSASKIIDWMGGDPEGRVAAGEAKYHALTAMQQDMPTHRLRREIRESRKEQAGAERGMTEFGLTAHKMSLGRRVQGPRDLLESVSQRLGTSPEDLGRKLSPTRMGDHSSLSRAAFGRSAKREAQGGQPNA